MELSFSTCWNSGRHTDGEQMLLEIEGMGFKAVELSHGIRVSMLEGIELYLKRSNAIRISSLHNFCPLPVEVPRASPNCYEFSSHRPTDRERAIRHTLRTIELARRLGVPVVVLHLGRVPISPIMPKLAKLATKGRIFSRYYVKLKLASVRAREKLAPFYLDRVELCLERIGLAAASAGIQLGIETREAWEEIPCETEFEPMLHRLDLSFPGVFGYWHDMGHAQLRENLGFSHHSEWLERLAPRLIGCHIHDVRWPATDHRVPFFGKIAPISFERLAPLLPRNTQHVFELSPTRGKREIIAARELWERQFLTNAPSSISLPAS